MDSLAWEGILNDLRTKLEKLEALAASNPNEHEVAAALLKIQELRRVEVDQEPCPMSFVHMEVSRNCVDWSIKLAEVIGLNFGVYTALEPNSIQYIGYQKDVLLAAQVLEQTRKFIFHAATGWWAEHIDGNIADYLHGYVQGLEEKFREQTNNNGMLIAKEPALVRYVAALGYMKVDDHTISSEGEMAWLAVKAGKAAAHETR
jgi:hypothetical protein